MSTPVPPGSIAIVGMAGRFPAASSVAELWRLLDQEREATRWLTDEELLAAGVSAPELSDPAYVRASLILPDLEMFDATFFGFSPREAAILDPQHRHFIECAWEALEDAGHMPERFPGAIGVFAGCGMQAYLPYNLLTNPDLLQSVGLFLLRHTGNDKDFLTTRLSYLLNLQGPSVAVQTACSTSLVAIHMACQSLLTGGCDLALAGGVTIELPHRRGYRFAAGEILSPDGHCRAFDDDAKGTLFGSGVGIVVLRRLEDAIQAGDNIHLVIRGSAVNNDGSGKAGYLAPSIDGQAQAAAEALAVADVDPATVSYIEAHGTGTAVGDPIELAALAQAYGGGPRTTPCGIGSIKTNIGHLDTAAGVASLIKVALALRHEKIPASLNYRRPNARFDMATSRFAVVDRGRPWPRGGNVRRAAVNSLGVGGTNAHAILEEPPRPITTPARQDWQLLTLSARTDAALQQLQEKWRQFTVELPADFTLADAAFTTQVGRRAFDHRCAILAEDIDGVRLALGGNNVRRAIKGVRAPDHRVVFMFPGGGAQYPSAARELCERVPAFRDAVEDCFRIMPAAVPNDLRTLMFERAANDAEAARALEQPVRALASLFVIEHAFAELWRSWGVRPHGVIGHSAGEYAAAVVAGVMTLKDALDVVVLRGQIFERMTRGGMLSVQITEAELRPLMSDELDVAVVNAADLCVVSGAVPAVEALEKRLHARQIESRRVRINVAAHSRLLDPHLGAFRTGFQRISLSAPQIPFVSTLTGQRAATDQLTCADYWVRQLRQTVRFADGLASVLGEPGTVLLEVGPGQGLSALARLAQPAHRAAAVVSSCRQADEAEGDLAFALAAAARLWTIGQDLQWDQIRGGAGLRRISLPTYPFERQRHWIEPGVPRAAADNAPATPGLRRLEQVDEWFQVPKWHPGQLPPASVDRHRHCLVFSDGGPLEPDRARLLADRGSPFHMVHPGKGFERAADGSWVVDPTRVEDFARLFSELEAEGVQLDGILYLWALDAARTPAQDASAALAQIFEPLFHLCQALQRHDPDSPVHLIVATAGTASVADEALTHPERATLIGPCRALGRESPLVSAQLVDLDNETAAAASGILHLLAEFDGRARDAMVAYRSHARWIEEMEPVSLAKPDRLAPRLTPGGVYVITGGFGEIGLELAHFLATQAGARLALIGRRALARAEWRPVAASAGAASDGRWMRRLFEIEAAGGELLALSADVADARQMQVALDEVRRRFGRINGVFHAAGVLDDAPLASKTAQDTRRVMGPKVGGAMVLDRLLPPGSIDFFAVFSSTSVSVGPAGQVDYIAANAFLDALAATRPDAFAIDWGIWGDIGMAARRYRTPVPTMVDRGPVLHPLIGSMTSRSDRGMCFEAILDRHATWLLEEHAVADRAVLPGMAYIEAARAAMTVIRPGPVEIANLSIVAPLAFGPGETRLLRTSLTASPDGFEFTVDSRTSRPDPVERDGWTTHAHAKARFIEPASATAGIGVLPNVTGLGPQVEWPEPAQAAAMSFGPRWRNLAAQRLGAECGIADIELPERFAGDLATFPFHPAMADMAATFGIALLERPASGDMLFLPISVERVRLAASLPRRIRSVCRLTKKVRDGLATFDVVCTDAAGNPLVSFEGLSLRCVDGANLARPPELHRRPLPLVEQMLNAGIRAADAPELFPRLLASPYRRVVVSSIPLAEVRRALAGEPDEARAPKPCRARPSSGTYANDIEAEIARLWIDLLGVERVDPSDDFFALGGHSLSAVRLFAKIRKQLGVDLPLASLFEAKTLRQLATAVASKAGMRPLETQAELPGADPAPVVPLPRAASETNEWPPLVKINPGDPARLPFFCVHGGGGNVLVYGDLCRRLGSDQPFYGLQACGVDGRRRPLPSVEAMAESYLTAIRQVQPTGPYVLGGYSGGGVIAFEMARRLIEFGQEVALLVMFDTVAPPLANQDPSQVRLWNVEYLVRRPARGIARRLARLVRSERAVGQATDAGNVRDIDDLEAMRALIRDHLVRDEIIPEELRGIHLYDAYMEAQRNYRPPPLHVPLVLFRGTEQAIPFMGERMLGWDRLITRPSEVRHIRSDHLGMMSAKNVERMSAVLRRRLDDINAHTKAADVTSAQPAVADQIAAE